MRSLGFCLAGVRARVGGLAGGLLLPRGGVRAPGVWPRLELAEDLRQVVRDAHLVFSLTPGHAKCFRLNVVSDLGSFPGGNVLVGLNCCGQL